MPLNHKEEKGLSCILGGLLGLVAMPFVSALHGFTLATLWGWFVVPLFGAPSLRILPAIGITLTVHLLTSKRSKTDKDDDPLGEIVSGIIFVVLYCGLTLGEGWIVMKLMG